MNQGDLSGKTKVELVAIAKSMKIRSPAYLDKESLIEAIEVEYAEPDAPEREEVALCIHGQPFGSCHACVKKRYCVHGKYKYSCRSCGGSRFCKHGKIFRGCRSCFEALENFKQSLRLKPSD